MRGAKGLLAAAVATALLVGCGPRAAGSGDWAGLVHPDELAKAGLKYYWNSSVPLLPGEKVRELYRLDENVYCLTTRNRLLCADALTGNFKWEARCGENGTVFAPMHANGVFLSPRVSGIREIMDPHQVPVTKPFNAVLVNTLTQVLVINRDTGEMVRKPGDIVFNGYVANGQGATDGVFFYIGSPTGEYHCIRLQEGVKLWTMTTSDKLEPVSAPPVLMGGHLFLTNEGGWVFCTATGRHGLHEWEWKMDGPSVGGFSVDDRGLFVPCMDHRIYAFTPLTGQKLWEPFICDGALRQAIQVGENSLFQYADGDKFYCLDLATGRLRWPGLREGRQVLAVTDGALCIRDARNYLLVVDEMLGTPRQKVGLTGHELFVGNATVPVLYTGRADGRLFCITPTITTNVTLDTIGAKGRKAAGPTIVTSRPATDAASAPAP